MLAPSELSALSRLIIANQLKTDGADSFQIASLTGG